eukprot:CAMPEP_0114615708 /NCGR_PEP_ID=MMETSP0168-20121206/6306_1 /TAXON_ID=95228 ORGANISM="Vannella sp., Strain DIVA3 517/6/12" /NCGR_SAMPLE_ID=MMETSP0168 /ASSEMBLY_ACC=CAM_ASM_000044 /LENGTH=221 /DNA_ID=CAMNT_0001826791 /DNA_START=100 /DNA_END=765 /DNA_ORIENTATION=-
MIKALLRGAAVALLAAHCAGFAAAPSFNQVAGSGIINVGGTGFAEESSAISMAIATWTLGLVVSAQPYQILDDAPYLGRALGERMANTSYRFGALVKAGVPLIFGSDWPVARAVPLLGIHAAVTRNYQDPATGEQRTFFPEERLTVDEALLAYTSTAAFAEFKEGNKGQVAPGHLADFVILDRDITALADEDEIAETAVLATYIDGVRMYASAAMPATVLA